MQIEKIFLKTSMDMEKNLGSLEVFMKAKSVEIKSAGTESARRALFVWAQLLDAQEQEADRIFPMELEERTGFCMEVHQPELWNPEYPVFYTLILELRDEEKRLLGCISKKVAFYSTAIEDRNLLLNGKKILWHKVPDEKWLLKKEQKKREECGAILAGLRKQHYNCLHLPAEQCKEMDRQICMEYGILVLDEEMLSCENINAGYHVCKEEGMESHPDFEIQVVEHGVLIENRSVFVNTNVYALRCEIFAADRIIQQSVVEADIPAGGKCYLDLPFVKLHDPGMYCYRVSLCLKKDEIWGKKGEKVAEGESLISNMWIS